MPEFRFLAVASTAVVICFGASMPVLAKIVAEPRMKADCAETAAAELGVSVDAVLTLPVERTSGTYHVYGQYPDSGQDVTLFECQYDKNKNFVKISVDGHHGHHSPSAGKAPRAAQRACSDMMGSPVSIEQVSPLRPGYHEIIMKETSGPRRVACTVTDGGSIEDWVEMN